MRTSLIALASTLVAASPALAQSAEPSTGWTPGEIVVTARKDDGYAAPDAATLRTPVSIQQTPQSVQVLTRTLIDEQDLTTLSDALRNVSSVVPAQPSEAVLTNPIVRGFESEVFIDGLIAYGDTAVVDPSSLSGTERIEVAKGPTSLLFGGGIGAPVGGLINVVTKVPTAKASYNFQLRGGSFKTIQPSFDINQPLADGVGIRVAGEYTSSDDFIDKVSIDRIALNPSFHAGLGAATDFTVRVGYSRVRQLEYSGLPVNVSELATVHPFRFTSASDAPRTETMNLMVTGVLTHRFSDKVSAAVQVRRYAGDSSEVASFPFPAFCFSPTLCPIFDGVLPATVREWTIDASLTAQMTTGGIEHVVIAGVQYDATNYRGDIGFGALPLGYIDYTDLASDVSFGTAPPLASPTINHYRTAALYLQDQLTIASRLHLLAGLRDSRNAIDEVLGSSNLLVGNPAINKSYSRIDPRVGATVDLAEGVAAFAGFATGSRQPTFYVVGTKPPMLETSTSYEAGIKFAVKSAGLSGTISWFHLTRDNVPTPAPSLTNPFAQEQSGRQRAQGVEADLIWEPTPNWSVLASYAHTDTKVLSDNDPLKVGNRLTRVPRDSGRVAVRYRFTLGPLAGVGIGLGMTAATGAETTLPNTVATKGYATFDAQASYKLGPVRVGVSVTNITGKTYFVPYRYLDQAVVRPGAPRSAFVTLGVGF